jgi:hypothetical protein
LGEKQRIWIRGLEKGQGVGWREKVVGRSKFDLGVANQKKIESVVPNSKKSKLDSTCKLIMAVLWN